MASDRQHSERVVCPYYRGHNGAVIYCEGPLDNTLVHIAFGSRKQMAEYMAVYCDDKYHCCIIGEQLDLKYHRKHKRGL